MTLFIQRHIDIEFLRICENGIYSYFWFIGYVTAIYEAGIIETKEVDFLITAAYAVMYS